jgi:hypothetical protein
MGDTVNVRPDAVVDVVAFTATVVVVCFAAAFTGGTEVVTTGMAVVEVVVVVDSVIDGSVTVTGAAAVRTATRGAGDACPASASPAAPPTAMTPTATATIGRRPNRDPVRLPARRCCPP